MLVCRQNAGSKQFRTLRKLEVVVWACVLVCFCLFPRPFAYVAFVACRLEVERDEVILDCHSSLLLGHP